MNKKIKFSIMFFIVAGIAAVVLLKIFVPKPAQDLTREVLPTKGTIDAVISTTGSILPKNRLEIKPPVNGRLDKIFVNEGDLVKAGQLLARISSTERAALLDAAQGQGSKEFEYWEQVYKPISLLSPIEGQVIVATMQPGQTILTTEAVVVLSDHLIVRAQVDETDIGKIKVGQKAVVSLDAYPDEKIAAVVGHIYYESRTVNNVTIYDVDLVAQDVPVFFRSGMNVNIDFVVQSKKDALLVPAEAVYRDKETAYVLIDSGNKEPRRQEVEIGMADDNNVEILSGISASDKILIKSTAFSLPKKSEVKSPFMPSRQRRTPSR